MADETLKKTPLNELHKSLGGKMVDFGGWELPVQYSGILDEHEAVRTRGGVFDVSHMGELTVRGPQALELLQRSTCNDVAKLEDGRAHYNGLLYPTGGFVDDILIYRIANDDYFVVVNASNTDKDYEWLAEQAKSFDVEVNNVSTQYAQLAVQGPDAERVLQSLTDVPLASIKYYRFAQGNVDGAPAIVSRTGYTGEDGFEVYLAPEHAPRLLQKLVDAGVKPCGLGARDTLRLEAKMALYGNDIDHTTTPIEADLGWIVKIEKGDFAGRDVLEREKAEGPRRKLVGFEMVDRGIARHGYPIVNGSEEVGVVTSGTHSPTLKKAIGLAYLPLDQSAQGTEFTVLIRGKETRARVIPTPFYKRAK
ncbi:MAG: glycine cleavage system aminomethyltransferase GcvT [Acidobacteria bacterium]|nr:glycine cleavage system aminomethyltransferase GcvT [Acidobacteriota bacterium]MBV9475643.1 glycine cleavage system aminomethyltransferase GcvT [Acidobacteriota bacterium]